MPTMYVSGVTDDRTSMYQGSASRVTIVAHLFGLLSLVLILVWLLHYQGGLEYDSNEAYRVFNVHPFVMFFGFIFMAGEAMMAFRTVAAERKVRKFIHMIFHLIAIILGIVGIKAVFKFHEMMNHSPDVYSLHSWIGIGTFSLFCLQWLIGFVTFMFPRASSPTRARFLPWHVSGGRALLYMAICAALTGLMEKATFLQLQHSYQARVINFTGLFILLFGIFVDLSIALGRYRFD